MSVIRKKPYIESVISALSEANLTTLQTIMNSGSAGTNASISNLPTGIVAVHFTMPTGRVVDGILINQSTLIGYDGTQRINLYKIANSLISEVYEYCDINELRRIVFDTANSGGVSVDTLLDKIEGSDYISVDENQAGTKVVVELDETNLETTAPAEDSSKLITSGAVYTGLSDKQDTILDSTEIVVNGSENKLYLENTISNKISRALTTPLSAPANEQLVSIGTNGAQQSVTIGNGLTLTNHSLSVSISGITYEVVQTLPASGVSGTIYLVPLSTSGTNNFYKEYIYVNNSWEQIGTTEVDLSNYYTKSQTDTLLLAKQNTLTAGTGISISGSTLSVLGMPYVTTAPSADNTSGVLKVAVLSTEPATRYANWLYIITEA